MKTIQATDTAVSIWFSREEPPEKERLLSLVRQALTERGLAPWPAVEAECFRAGEDMLVIARPGRARRLGFRFDDLEALLGAVLACPVAESSLYDGGQGYILTVDRAGAAPVLWEYGREEPVSADWELHAAEQGARLLRDGAIDDLKRYFSR